MITHIRVNEVIYTPTMENKDNKDNKENKIHWHTYHEQTHDQNNYL